MDDLDVRKATGPDSALNWTECFLPMRSELPGAAIVRLRNFHACHIFSINYVYFYFILVIFPRLWIKVNIPEGKKCLV